MRPHRASAWRLLDMASGLAIGLMLAFLVQSGRAAPAPSRLPVWYSGPQSGCLLIKMDNFGAEQLTPSPLGSYWVDASWRCTSPLPKSSR